MKKIIKRVDKEKFWLMFMVILVFPCILLGTGTITSGWHLVDDHETIALVGRKIDEGVSFWSALDRALESDITHRWRPAYWFFRVLGAYLFGGNSMIHNIFLCVVGMVCYWLLYQTARNLECKVMLSHIFALLVSLGRQYEIWYRVANQENAGLLLVAVCLWIMSKQYKEKFSTKAWYDVLLGICAIIGSLMKESFFLLLPGIILLRLVLEGICQEGGIRKWGSLLIRRLPLWGTALLAFLWSAYMIIFYVGTAPISYAGVDVDLGWKQVVWDIMKLPKESLNDYVLVTIILFLAMVVGLFFSRKDLKKISLGHILWLLFGVYVVVGQVILYAKSGMWDRYLVPFIVGYGIIFVVFTDKLVKNKYLYLAYISVLLVFIGTRGYMSVVRQAIPYAKEGHDIEKMLDLVSETSDDGGVLVSLGAIETDNCVDMYLENRGVRAVSCYKVEEEREVWEDDFYISIEEVLKNEWNTVVMEVDYQRLLEYSQIADNYVWQQIGDTFIVGIEE